MNEKYRVLLIGSEDEENLAIRYLGAVLKHNGCEVSLSACSMRLHFKEVLQNIKRSKPQLIGISLSFEILANMYFDLVNEIRQKGYKGHITVGGHFPTFEYKKILETQSGIDSVIRFEGEKPLAELVNSLKNKSDFFKVHNLVYRNRDKIIENKCYLEFENLDGLPFPIRDKKARYMVGEKFATLLSSRGCYHSACLYCCIAAFHNQKTGCKFAVRTPKNVAKELSYLYHNLGIRVFQFHDDNFMLAKKDDTINRIDNLRKEMINLNIDINKIAFIIKARPDSIDDNVAQKLKELGVTGIFLGIENASESGLKNLIRLNSLEDIHTSLAALKKQNITITYNLLLFYPDATIEEIDKNIEFIKKYDYIRFDIARAEPVVGSPLARLLKNRSKLIDLWPNSSYICEDEKVEKMCDLYIKFFRSKDSQYTKLCHYGISLSYHIGVLERLHPGKVSNELIDNGKDLINEINIFSLQYIRLMRDLSIKQNVAINLKEIYPNFQKKCKAYTKEMEDLTNKMLRLQVTETNFEKYGVRQIVQANPLIRKIFKY